MNVKKVLEIEDGVIRSFKRTGKESYTLWIAGRKGKQEVACINLKKKDALEFCSLIISCLGWEARNKEGDEKCIGC